MSGTVFCFFQPSPKTRIFTINGSLWRKSHLVIGKPLHKWICLMMKNTPTRQPALKTSNPWLARQSPCLVPCQSRASNRDRTSARIAALRRSAADVRHVWRFHSKWEEGLASNLSVARIQVQMACKWHGMELMILLDKPNVNKDGPSQNFCRQGPFCTLVGRPFLQNPSPPQLARRKSWYPIPSLWYLKFHHRGRKNDQIQY